MACNCNNNQYAKSCVRAYNNAIQPFTAANTQLTINGTPVVNTGCSLTLNPANISVNKTGLYRFSADVTYTATDAGIVTIQFYQNGVALPCAISQETVAAGSTYTNHIETDLGLRTCCVNNSAITLFIGGVAGNVIHTCVGGVKLA